MSVSARDLEEYSAEMNAQVDTTNNILGQKSIKISSYDKSGSVEPYYADKDSPLFEKIAGDHRRRPAAG